MPYPIIPAPALLTAKELLDLIAKDAGVDVDELLGLATFDSISPGICTACHTIHDSVEPDADHNACEECGQYAVKSALTLAGLV